jgi:hypothetical protein
MDYLNILNGIGLTVASISYLLYILKKEKKSKEVSEEIDYSNIYDNTYIYSGLIALAIVGVSLIYKGIIE